MGAGTAVAGTGSPSTGKLGRPRRRPLPSRRALDDPAASFADLLAGFRERAGLSQVALGRRAGVDASYLNRLESGERRVPTPDLLGALVAALDLDPPEADRLWWSLDLLPPALRRLGDAAPTLLAVARVLAAPQLAPGARDDFRACVETLARHWDARSAQGCQHSA